MRLIDADALKKAFEETVCIEPMPYAFVRQIIDNTPTVVVDNYSMGYQDGVRKVLTEREKNEKPKGDKDLCETCKHSEVCELSTKIFSECRTTQCYKHEETENEQ